MADEQDDLVSLSEAAQLLQVPEEQVLVMAEQGMISPVDREGGPCFRRAEVVAAGEAGA